MASAVVASAAITRGGVAFPPNRDAAALASHLGTKRHEPTSMDGNAGLAALQFASGTSSPTRAFTKKMPKPKPTDRGKEAPAEAEPPLEARAQPPPARLLADWTAKLLVLPLVGVSLCGALTLLLGVHWLEAVQRRRHYYYYYYWYSRPPSLASLWALMPARDADAASANGDRERRAPARSPSARPAKRHRAEGDAVDESALLPRQPKPRSPLTSVSPPRTGSAGSGRRRRRRRVFIWDLDETLVLFASLYTGAFAQTHGKEEAPGVALGEQMMAFLLAMLERHFFFGALHDTDVDHISCAEGDRCANCSRTQATAAAAAAPVRSQESGDVQREAEDARELERKTRYRRIRDIYERRGPVDFLHDDQSEWFAVRAALVQAIDAFSTGWLHEARQVLALIEATNASTAGREGRDREAQGEREAQPATRNQEEEEDEEEDEDEALEQEQGEQEVEHVNLLVTNTQLVPALCKCLVYELDAFFPIERVYSSAKVHKYRCFEAIMAKYRADSFRGGADGEEEDVAVEFVAIGDGLEEEQVSLALGLEFHKIRSLADLQKLRYDLQLVDRPPTATTTTTYTSPVVSAAATGRSGHTPTMRTCVSTMAVAVDTQEQ